MINMIKIIFILLFISCDQQEAFDFNDDKIGCMNAEACNFDSSADTEGTCLFPEENYDCDGNLVTIYGCTNENACGYNIFATDDDGSCIEEFIYCADYDGDGLGNSTVDDDENLVNTRNVCETLLNGIEIGNDWVNNCIDDDDNCNGVVDDCGACNRNNLDKDCFDICYGAGVLINDDECCEPDRIQDYYESDQEDSFTACLPETFKWSLSMTGIVGELEGTIFTPSEDANSQEFTFGTHYLSIDGLFYKKNLTK